MIPRPAVALALACMIAAACASVRPAAPGDAFWSALEDLCGRTFQGTVREAPAGDTAFAGKLLLMQVRECNDDVVRIPFHVGANRSRTWVVSRTPDGVRLKHDHRHEDGSEDAITQYGGDTRTAGTPQIQEFYADAHTTRLIPAAATNVWTIEIRPGRTFAYALRREGTDRRFRIEFDLTREAAAPPPPWGAR